MSNKETFYKVIFEDNHLIAINKAPGVLVQGDQTGDLPLSEMLKTYIGKKYNKPGAVFCGVIHRIDRPVSGLVLMARTSKALSRMNEQFKKREVRKFYWALTDKKPETEAGSLKHWLIKNSTKNRVNVFDKPKGDAQKAELEYRIIGRQGNFYLWQVELKTGRPHQIRAQLAKINCPIKGDIKYGYPKKNPDDSIHLHSKAMIFIHPVRKEENILEAKTPNDPTWNLFKEFKFEAESYAG